MTRQKIPFGLNVAPGAKPILLAGFFAGSMFASQALAQSTAATPTPSPHAPAATTAPATAAKAPTAAPASAMPASPTRFQPNRFAGRAGRFYALFWGIESPTVKAVEAGELIRFSYHVLDPERAKAINDKKNDAFLIFPDAQIRLSVPSLEKVGQLRQSSTPEAGKTYWMAFSNPGRRVKRGDRVNIVIGHFQAEGLVVE